MKDVLQLVYEYRRLVAERDLIGVRPTDQSEERLRALERLFGREPGIAEGGPHAGRRRHARCDISAPAVMRLHGTDHPVTLINVGGGGACLEGAPSMAPGSQAVLRIRDGRSLYQFQVEARWRQSSDGRLGLPFVGIPRSLPIPSPSEPPPPQ